jgi:hypothetical protein
MFDEGMPRNALSPYEMQNASGVKTFARELWLHFRIQEQRYETLMKTVRQTLVNLNGAIRRNVEIF